MADIIRPLRRAPVAPLPDPDMLELAEQLFFAYRDFTADADALLAEYGFGRAHHRVLHFVARHPGLRVRDLLGLLRITKQSLGRVLRDLLARGFIAQETGRDDRRERHLRTTPAGAMLAARLAAPQSAKLALALAAAGGRRETVEAFLSALISARNPCLTPDDSP